MLKLYGSAKSRAAIVEWYLEELQVPYEYITLDLEAGENTKPDFLAINPLGKVPALVDEALRLWESGAILLYLAQKYDPSYPKSLEKQAEIYQWTLFANSTLSQEIFTSEQAERNADRILAPLNHILKTQTWILGDAFSVADVAVGAALAYIPIALDIDLSPYPDLLLYINRLTERSAFMESIGKRF